MQKHAILQHIRTPTYIVYIHTHVHLHINHIPTYTMHVHLHIHAHVHKLASWLWVMTVITMYLHICFNKLKKKKLNFSTPPINLGVQRKRKCKKCQSIELGFF